MKLLACLKIIPDLDQMSSEDYVADGNGWVDTSFVRTMWNCFDESGLELGLRLSDKAESLNLQLEKTALTIGGEPAELYLKTLYALKYEHTVRIDDKGCDIRFMPGCIAREIAAYVRQYPQDYIIMGQQAAPGNNGLTPYFTAAALGVPLFIDVVDIHLLDEGRLKVLTEAGGNLYEQIIQKPAVLSIGNAAVSKLRVPTLKDRLQYGKKEVMVRQPRELGNDKSVIPAELTYMERKRAGTKIEVTDMMSLKRLIAHQKNT